MKLYATVTSERATKGQGGEYLDIKIYTTNREAPTHTVRVREWKEKSTITVDLCSVFFGKERMVAREVLYINKEKGEKQKSECEHKEVFNAKAEYCTHCKNYLKP